MCYPPKINVMMWQFKVTCSNTFVPSGTLMIKKCANQRECKGLENALLGKTYMPITGQRVVNQ